MVATDNGSPQNFNSTVEVIITVLSPDNQFSPVLNAPSYTGEVDENRAPGDVIVSFTVTDGDQFGPASQIGRLDLLGGDADLFVAEITGSNSGVIRTK